jgi:putative transposase
LFRLGKFWIIYILRTGCQWKMLPKEYGSGSTCHRWFQQWIVYEVFQKLWVRLLEVYDDLKGIRWMWQSLDSVSIKAPLGLHDRFNPTYRGKRATKKRHLLTDQRGIPVSVVITPANIHDMKTSHLNQSLSKKFDLSSNLA